MQDIIIKNNTQKLGGLTLLEYLPVNGTPVKAELFYVLYSLKLNDIVIDGLYSDKFIVYNNLLFVTELFIEKTEEGFGIFEASLLKQVDLISLKVRNISSLKNGYIYPVKIENNKIIYTKTNLNSSIKKEFEQELLPISN